MIFAQGGEAADKLLQIFQGKIVGNPVSIFNTRIHPKGIFASLQKLHSNPQKVLPHRCIEVLGCEQSERPCLLFLRL
jgi:hypothetical protein